MARAIFFLVAFEAVTQLLIYNLAACKKEEVVLYAKTNCAVAAAAKVNLDEGFVYNKDAHNRKRQN